MEKKLLPIGTVVQLHEDNSRIIIAGYFPSGTARPGYIWDYSGFSFPLGYRKADEILQFDHEQIETVFAMGYQDEEQFEFMEQLEAAAAELKNSESDETGGEEHV